jgi:hypothetical protein
VIKTGNSKDRQAASSATTAHHCQAFSKALPTMELDLFLEADTDEFSRANAGNRTGAAGSRRACASVYFKILVLSPPGVKLIWSQ